MSEEQDPDLDNQTEGDELPEENGADDVSLRPGPNADDQADIEQYISAEVRALYDVYSYRHAAAILATSFPDELAEIERALLDFRITTRDIGTPGGNESDMPKKYSRTLRPAGWAVWGNQSDEYFPDWPTYSNHSQSERGTVASGAVSLAAAPYGID